MGRVATSFFEDLYRADEDPWGFATSAYEQAKYDTTLTALGDRRFARGLELGCSIGVLTARLAARCDALVALEPSDTARARAAARLTGVPGVELRAGAAPEDVPDGPFDLVVASEVLYYLDRELLAATLDRLAAVAVGGARLVCVHWTGHAPSYPLSADEVHLAVLAHPAFAAIDGARHEGFRIDVLDRRP